LEFVLESPTCTVGLEQRAMPISLVFVEDIPLPPSTIYKKLGDKAFPEPYCIKGRSCWLKEEVDAWLNPDETVQRLLARKGELTEGFTEYELRCRSWEGLRDRALNLQALKILVESGALQRSKLPTYGRPRVEYRWRVAGG
jgi:hypothetical protein